MQPSWEGDGVEEVLIPHNGKLIRIAMYEGDVSVLTLGEMKNTALAWAEQLEVIHELALEVARAFGSNMPVQRAGYQQLGHSVCPEGGLPTSVCAGAGAGDIITVLVKHPRAI